MSIVVNKYRIPVNSGYEMDSSGDSPRSSKLVLRHDEHTNEVGNDYGGVVGDEQGVLQIGLWPSSE